MRAAVLLCVCSVSLVFGSSLRAQAGPSEVDVYVHVYDSRQLDSTKNYVLEIIMQPDCPSGAEC